MTLEFNKVQEQVERMGRMMAQRNISMSERAMIAWEQFETLGDLDAIHARIRLARERDIGYRGAAPPDPDSGIREPVNRAYPLPTAPDHATILAADGSQVYPSLHAPALYYLTNVGVLVYHHGTDRLPEQLSEPHLHYSESDLRDDNGHLITTTAVNARRNVRELATLTREAWEQREHAAPILALGDGPLLWWANKDVPDGPQLEQEYLGLLVHFYDLHAHMQREHASSASLTGYVDRPTSSFLVSLVHLMRLAEDEVRERNVKQNGDLEGLIDQWLMFKLLKPGQRSAILVQQSPQNKRYRNKGTNFEIAFFYINVGTESNYHLARVELPLWVAQNPPMVDLAHALIVDQCAMMWRYPYALTRADELAVIRGHERTHLASMIEVVLRANDQAIEQSQKEASKSSRHGRLSYGQRT